MERTVIVGIGEVVTGFNYGLHLGPSISGRVTDVDTGLPMTNIRLRAEGAGNK